MGIQDTIKKQKKSVLLMEMQEQVPRRKSKTADEKRKKKEGIVNARTFAHFEEVAAWRRG